MDMMFLTIGTDLDDDDALSCGRSGLLSVSRDSRTSRTITYPTNGAFAFTATVGLDIWNSRS